MNNKCLIVRTEAPQRCFKNEADDLYLFLVGRSYLNSSPLEHFILLQRSILIFLLGDLEHGNPAPLFPLWLGSGCCMLLDDERSAHDEMGTAV